MFSLTISLLGILVVTLLAGHKFIFHPAFISPLSRIPKAHWSAPFSDFWILWTRYWAHENEYLHAAHLKLGPVIRLGPNELSINDVDGIRTVYAGGFEKGPWYSIFDNYGVPCMFSSLHSRPHSARKRFISNIYSKSQVQTSPALAAQSKTIIYSRLLPILASTTAEVEIHSIWNAATMDSITAYLFGLKNASNFLQNEKERYHWLDLYHSRKTHTFYPQELPFLTKFLKNLGLHLVPKWVDEANQELEGWTQAHCDMTEIHLSSNFDTTHVEDEPVVYSALHSGIKKEDKKGSDSVLFTETLKYPKLSIASEMIDHLAAGHETSGITLTYLSYYLSKNLILQNKLQAELLTLSPAMKIEQTELPSSKELDALPLLHAILMETLRLRASIPGNQPRMTPYPSSTIGPYTIPGGVRIGAQAYSLHRNEAVYPDPEKWDYTRWLDSENGYTEEQRKARDRCFWAFSSGGRMCVGSNFAMHEIKLVVAAVYTNFRTHIVKDDGIEQEDGYTCGPVSNKLFLRFERV